MEPTWDERTSVCRPRTTRGPRTDPPSVCGVSTGSRRTLRVSPIPVSPRVAVHAGGGRGRLPEARISCVRPRDGDATGGSQRKKPTVETSRSSPARATSRITTRGTSTRRPSDPGAEREGLGRGWRSQREVRIGPNEGLAWVHDVVVEGNGEGRRLPYQAGFGGRDPVGYGDVRKRTRTRSATVPITGRTTRTSHPITCGVTRRLTWVTGPWDLPGPMVGPHRVPSYRAATAPTLHRGRVGGQVRPLSGRGGPSGPSGSSTVCVTGRLPKRPRNLRPTRSRMRGRPACPSSTWSNTRRGRTDLSSKETA